MLRIAPWRAHSAQDLGGLGGKVSGNDPQMGRNARKAYRTNLSGPVILL